MSAQARPRLGGRYAPPPAAVERQTNLGFPSPELMARVDAEMARTEALENLDQEHRESRPGHVLLVEKGFPQGFPSERYLCGCGWTGPWFKTGYLIGGAN